jgi:hypothetical protein
LGHNFSIGDKIYVTSKNGYNIPTGMYKVMGVDGDKVFINTKPKSFYPLLNNSTATAATAMNARATTPSNNTGTDSNHGGLLATTFKTKTITDFNNDKLLQSIPVRNLLFNSSDIQIFNENRPSIYPYVRSDYSVAKVIEKEQLEYYIKVLEVIDVVEELDDCGFSENNFNEAVMNYFINHDINIKDMVNNLGEPIYDFYLGVVKNGSPTATGYGNVESHFSRFIDFVKEGDGLEGVTNNATTLGKKLKKGDVLYHSLCEYTTEQLLEKEISYIHHKFIHKDVLFNYNPFYRKQIKLISSYIENGDNVYNIAAHAVYSRLDQRYVWRDLFDIGVADENGNMIDFPFMNGSFYVYTDINFFLKSEKNCTRKYVLNVNDVSSISGSKYSNYVSDILNDINLGGNDTNGATGNGSNSGNNGSVLPYYQYTNLKC